MYQISSNQRLVMSSVSCPLSMLRLRVKTWEFGVKIICQVGVSLNWCSMWLFRVKTADLMILFCQPSNFRWCVHLHFNLIIFKQFNQSFIGSLCLHILYGVDNQGWVLQIRDMLQASIFQRRMCLEIYRMPVTLLLILVI